MDATATQKNKTENDIMSEEIDNEAEFGNTFSVLAGGNATQTEDAPATLDQGDSLASQEAVIETEVEEVLALETETVIETEEEEGGETNWEEKFNSLQKEHDALDKQKRDNQSYNDSRFAELEKKINEGSVTKVEETPQKEYTKEELSDLQYEDPDKYFAVMTKRQGLQQPQSQQVDIPTQINIGIQRSLNADFDEMVNLADDAAKYNPKLMEEVMASPDRAKAAYEMGKKISASQTQETDPVAYKEKIRQEILAEMEGKKTNPKTLHKVPGARTPRQVKKSGSSDGFGFGTLAGSGAKK